MNTRASGEKPQQSDDSQLVDLVRTGDREAFGVLFTRHAGRVRRLLVSLLGPNDELDDLTQEVFLNVFRSIDRFRGAARFTTWLHRITVNTAMSAMRRPRRADPTSPMDMDRRPGTVGDAEGTTHGREMVRRMYGILDSMTPKRRVAYVLFELEGRSIVEVARVTGVSVPVAKSRIFFARRELLRKAGEDACLAPLLEELRQCRTS